MDKDTCIILNHKREIIYILQDGFALFQIKKISILDEIVAENSLRLFKQFFDTISDGLRIFSWPIEIFVNAHIQKVYFSGLFCMDHYLVCLSKIEHKYDFLSIASKHMQRYDALDSTSVNAANNNDFNEISILNNELIEIQRKLTRKNLNLEMLNERLEELATTDPLTGMYNRRAVFDRLDVELSRALRERRAFGLALLDLDAFKKINDQFGHLMGDEALKITSMCLRESTRNYDIAGRIGGDEFLIFFSVMTREEFEMILNRLLSEINDHKMDISGEVTIRIKASIGGVFVHSDKDVQELGINLLMKKADDELYNAKDAGGNSVRIQEL